MGGMGPTTAQQCRRRSFFHEGQAGGCMHMQVAPPGSQTVSESMQRSKACCDSRLPDSNRSLHLVMSQFDVYRMRTSEANALCVGARPIPSDARLGKGARQLAWLSGDPPDRLG